MTRPPDETRTALSSHAAETLAGARGRTLVLGDALDHWGPLGPAVSEVVVSTGGAELAGSFDAIVSVGALADAPDLVALLGTLRNHVGPESRLWFCEPTGIAGHTAADGPPDITTTLWAQRWSVIDCRRFRWGAGRRRREFVWGCARLGGAAPSE